MTATAAAPTRPRHVELADGGRLAYDLTLPSDRPVDRSIGCVIYLHGFASSRDGEKASFFGQRFTSLGFAVCAYDCRGHGASSGSMRDLTLSRNLDDLRTVHEHLRRGLPGIDLDVDLEFDRFVLFGSSMGGGTALWYASEHPDTIDAVIGLAPAIELETGLLRAVGEEGVADWRRRGVTLFRHELGDHELSWELIEDLRRYELPRLQEGYATPTLLLQGMRDDSVSWRAVAELAAACGGPVETHLWADGDHRLVDRLPVLWEQIETFLGRLPSRRAVGERRVGGNGVEGNGSKERVA